MAHKIGITSRLGNNAGRAVANNVSAKSAALPAVPVSQLKDKTGEEAEPVTQKSLKVISSTVAQLRAKSYTRGTELHEAPGREKNLPLESWHAAQPKTLHQEAKGFNLRDNNANLKLPHKNSSPPAITQMEQAPIQRVYSDDKYETLPYGAGHKPPDFEYWVNSMWGEVEDVAIKQRVMDLLKGKADDPRAGGTLDVTTKKTTLDVLYAHAYKEKVWVSAAELIREGSLVHQINAPVGGPTSTKSITIAAGYHGTWRDPNTVINLHKGTIPTIERHGKDPSDKAGIQEFMKKGLGIEEWHPFWFGGDISSRPFLFRNKQEDNELDTTISVAKSAIDSLDFPMIESMDKKDIAGYDDNGMPITYNYVYLVGVTEGFGTTVNMQQTNAFGEGEMGTQGLQASDHFGYVKYKRVHAGGSRNEGYSFERVFQDLLPGARQKNISKQVSAIIAGMPKSGINRTNAEAFNFNNMYVDLTKTGANQANSALKNKFAKHKAAWSNEQWKQEAEKQNAIKIAPSQQAKEIRLNKFLEGVRSVIPF